MGRRATAASAAEARRSMFTDDVGHDDEEGFVVVVDIGGDKRGR